MREHTQERLESCSMVASQHPRSTSYLTIGDKMLTDRPFPRKRFKLASRKNVHVRLLILFQTREVINLAAQ